MSRNKRKGRKKREKVGPWVRILTSGDLRVSDQAIKKLAKVVIKRHKGTLEDLAKL